MEDGGWRMEDGGWRIEDRGSLIEDVDLYSRSSNLDRKEEIV